jgi:hypothetical protein
VKTHTRPARTIHIGRVIKGDRIVLLGRESNVKIVQMMGEYLIDTINRLLPYQASEHMSKSAHSWREGCVDRLAERIRAKFEAMKQEDSAHDSEGSVAAPGTALVVRSIFEQEEIANYDARYGAGAWVRHKQREVELEQWYAEAPKREAERMRIAQEKRAELLAKETPEERKVRKAQEAKETAKRAREEARFNERYWKDQERAANRIDRSAYRAGAEAGNKIGLNTQVGAGSKNKSIGEN